MYECEISVDIKVTTAIIKYIKGLLRLSKATSILNRHTAITIGNVAK